MQPLSNAERRRIQTANPLVPNSMIDKYDILQSVQFSHRGLSKAEENEFKDISKFMFGAHLPRLVRWKLKLKYSFIDFVTRFIC